MVFYWMTEFDGSYVQNHHLNKFLDFFRQCVYICTYSKKNI